MSLPLGVSLPPDSVHALSVSMPEWQHVVGYEENKREVLDAMACGYPRFFVHPLVVELTHLLQSRPPFAPFFSSSPTATDASTWSLMVLPTRIAAERLQTFLLATAANDATIAHNRTLDKNSDVTVTSVHDGLVFAVRLPQCLTTTAKQFWQHSGEIVTSRHAELALQVLRQHSDGLAASKTTADQLQMDDTPSHTALRARIASLYPSFAQPADVSLYPTGMAAIFASVRLVRQLRPLAKSILVGFPYVDTLKILQRSEWNAAGIHFFPVCDAAVLEAIDTICQSERISGIFTEFPGNPLLSTPALCRLAAAAHANGTALVVDDTIGSYNVNVMQHDAADVVTTSLSKHFSGSCTVMGGSVVLNPHSAVYSSLKQQQDDGQSDSFIALADVETLLYDSNDVLNRLVRVNATTNAIVHKLQTHPLVKQLYYPGLVCDKEARKESVNGFTRFLTRPSGGKNDAPQYGPLFSLVLHGGLAPARAFYNALDVAKGPSLGTNFTICCPYTLLAHYNELAFVESCGVDRHLLRISIGLEPVDELWRKVEIALDAAQAAAAPVAMNEATDDK